MNYLINEIDYFVKKIAVIKTKKVVFVIQKTMKQKIVVVVVVNFKSRSKIKFSKSFKSFKFEKFIMNFNLNSTSMKFNFEFFIQSENYETLLINYKN